MSVTFVRRAAALIAATALTLALSACSGSSQGESESTVTPDPTAGAPVGSSTGSTGTTSDPTVTASGEPTPDVDPVDLIGTLSGVGGRVCNLLDPATIETITGLPFGAVEPTGDTADAKQTTCEWSLDGDVVAIVQVLVLDDQGSSLAMQRAAAGTMYDDVTDAAVEGAGSGYSYMAGRVVAVQHDGDYVQVMYLSASQPDTAPITLQLAAEVLANR